MVIQSLKAYYPYQGVQPLNYSGSYSPRMTKTPSLRLIENKNYTASRIAFQASIEKTFLSQKYWNDLLEKLRKAGGGGGGNDPRFDRIAVSFMMTNFLVNKFLKQILNDFAFELLKVIEPIINQLNFSLKDNLIPKIVKGLESIFHSIQQNNLLFLQRLGKTATNLSHKMISLAIIISFQLNKLKEILEEELNNQIRKLDVKNKLKKIKTFVTDFFAELKDDLINFFELFKTLYKN